MTHKGHMGRMEGVTLLREYLRLLDKEMDGFPDDSEMSLLVRNICNSLSHRLRATMNCWEIWKRLLPESLRWDGYDRKRLYEIVALDFMDRNNAFLMGRISECSHLDVCERDDKLVIEVYDRYGPTATILFVHDDTGRQMVTYEDPKFDVKVARRLWSYDLMGHEPSFR